MTRAGEELVFAPLGGVGEIGMNLSLYGIGASGNRTWIAVDFGVSFSGDDLPGVEVILPDIRFLVEERKNLAGIVLTHAHEDHFGALLDLWPQLRVPVYAGPFTAALIEAKRRGEPGAPEIGVAVVTPGSRFKLGPFDLELVPVTHSIPEANALAIRTPFGTVLHTGDWKIDPTPVMGAPMDEARFSALGREGVLAVVGDSTNAIRDGRSPSEREVAHTLADLVRSAPGRVAVTTFASNVGRIRSAAQAAFANGREVVVIGRAMERIVQVARETGYLDGIEAFRDVEAYAQLAPNRVVALCTGSQGERRAALARIAEESHPAVSLAKGDRVIFSSRTIPGNERAVNRIINGLVEQGVEVITDRDALVHASGHPRREELETMYRWIRPQIAIPVHGEALHLHEHAKLIRRLGIEQTILCRNGDLVRLAPAPAGIIDEVPAARLYKDGRLIVEAGATTIPERRRLSFGGVVSVALVISSRGELLADPDLNLSGIPERTSTGDLMRDVARAAVRDTFASLPRPKQRDPEVVTEALTRAVRAAVAAQWDKKPVCHVHVLTL
jgi:ribonuclease J